MKILNGILKAIDLISEHTGNWVSLLVVPMTFVLFFEVVMRYVFNKPTIWVHETSNYFFGAIFVLGGAYTLLHEGHVNVEILHIRLPLRARAFLDILTAGVFFLLFIVIFKYGYQLAAISVKALEHSHTVWGPPVYPIKVLVPLSAMLIMLQGFAKLIRDFQTLITGRSIRSPFVGEEVVSE